MTTSGADERHAMKNEVLARCARPSAARARTSHFRFSPIDFPINLSYAHFSIREAPATITPPRVAGSGTVLVAVKVSNAMFAGDAPPPTA